MLECEEYRLKDGRGPDGKKGSPIRQSTAAAAADGGNRAELPCGPADPAAAFARAFHSAELRRLTRARPRAVSYVIQVLRRLNLIEQIGVENRFHIYRLTKDPSF